MKDSSRISLSPRTSMPLWLGAVLPLAVGLATGGLAAALGAAFAAACPVLMVVTARWPARAPRIFPFYFAVLFVIALVAFEFNSAVFVVDTWSALVLGMLAIPTARPRPLGKALLHGSRLG